MSIKYIIEIDSIDDFEAWGGGLTVLNRIREADKIKELDELLDELQECAPFESATQLNDFLWFDLENYDGFSYDELEEAIKENNK